MEEYQVEVERDGVVLIVVQDQVAIAADHAHHGVGTVLALSTITITNHDQPTMTNRDNKIFGAVYRGGG